ncbi:hypothetical protein [Streptomyces sp. NPDC059349]|uniref:hypothetical protein n=1 Tax=Streptomyces sp. NPDC059349 TaxID=3346808 RepID=UPI0036B1319B
MRVEAHTYFATYTIDGTPVDAPGTRGLRSCSISSQSMTPPTLILRTMTSVRDTVPGGRNSSLPRDRPCS